MQNPNFNFTILSKDRTSAARAGILHTPHGDVPTPIFMPVGTLANVKTLSPADLSDAHAHIVLGNTYHLRQHPGVDIVSEAGGLSKFMGWAGPTLTDSGGFQVFSLSNTRKVTEEGVEFRSVYDGSLVNFTPETVLGFEQAIGADMIVALDECPPFPAEYNDVERAVELTARWADRFMKAWRQSNSERDSYQAAFLVVQGGVYSDLRKRSVEQMATLDPPGFCIGGVSVGEPQEEMIKAASICCDVLPDEKPRHLLGVGTPHDILAGIEAGVDMFDCVMPTRNGRNCQVFTSQGVVNLRNSRWSRDQNSLDEQCTCYTCRTFSLSYLHHLAVTGEILGMRLLSLHNITFYLSLVKAARCAILSSNYNSWRRKIELDWETGT